jgi:hypothetical protein
MSFEGFFNKYSTWIIVIIVVIFIAVIITLMIKGMFSTETHYLINMTNISNETLRLLTKVQ